MASAKRIAQRAAGSSRVGSPSSYLPLAEYRRRVPDAGFTLIERLVVIAIIAVLAALLLPALGGAKQQGQSAKCKSNLHQIGTALAMYVEDFGCYPQYFPQTYDPGVVWSAKLVPYLKCSWTNRAIHCPAYTGPLNEITELSASSYGYNVGGAMGGPPPLGIGDQTGGDLPVRENQVFVPSDMIALADSQELYGSEQDQTEGTELTEAVTGWYGVDWLRCALLPESTHPRQHGKNYNDLFCDTHVSEKDPLILFDPTESATEWNCDHQPHAGDWMQTWESQ